MAVIVLVGVAAAGALSRSDESLTTAEQPELIFVPIEEGKLRNRLVTRGNVTAPNPTIVHAAAPAPDRDPVVTAVAEVGSSVNAGDVVYEMAGRPVFALAGAVPAYRDLEPGDRGDDVVAIQRALTALELYAGPHDGEYGPATADAVARLYTSRGYEQPAPSPDAVALLDSLLAERQSRASGPSTPDLVRVVADLDARINEARAGLAAPFVRREFVFFDVLPATVGSVDVPVGSIVEPGAPLLSTSSGDRAIEVQFLDPGFGRFVGLPVEIELDPTSGRAVAGLVERETVDAEGEPVLVVTADNLSSSALGQNVKVTIVENEAERASLLVPSVAVVTEADGGTVVDRLRDGTVTRVPVVVGDESDGMSAVRPGVDGDLLAGDRVGIEA